MSLLMSEAGWWRGFVVVVRLRGGRGREEFVVARVWPLPRAGAVVEAAVEAQLRGEYPRSGGEARYRWRVIETSSSQSLP